MGSAHDCPVVLVATYTALGTVSWALVGNCVYQQTSFTLPAIIGVLLLHTVSRNCANFATLPPLFAVFCLCLAMDLMESQILFSTRLACLFLLTGPLAGIRKLDYMYEQLYLKWGLTQVNNICQPNIQDIYGLTRLFSHI